MSVADDYGRYYANPATIRGACWPTHPSPPCEQTVDNLLAECTQGTKPLISIYVVEGCRYLQITDFNQKIRSKSKFPYIVRSLSTDCGQVADKVPALDVVEVVVGDGVEDAIRDRALCVREKLHTLRKPNAADLNGSTSQRFDEFWNRYPRKQHKDAACAEWVSLVITDSEPAVFACLDRYLLSSEVARGAVANPEKWLLEQYRDGWSGSWPSAQPAAPDRRESPMESAMRKAKEAKNGTR
jgi:hypothetical protein